MLDAAEVGEQAIQLGPRYFEAALQRLSAQITVSNLSAYISQQLCAHALGPQVAAVLARGYLKASSYHRKGRLYDGGGMRVVEEWEHVDKPQQMLRHLPKGKMFPPQDTSMQWAR